MFDTVKIKFPVKLKYLLFECNASVIAIGSPVMISLFSVSEMENREQIVINFYHSGCKKK